MDNSLSEVDFTELDLASPVRELVQRLLNGIETLVADLNEAQAQIQRLRDARAGVVYSLGRNPLALPHSAAEEATEEKTRCLKKWRVLR